MQTFQKEKKAVKKIQNLLILICRTIAVAFLVFAFSQPFISPSNETKNAKETIISIFIDNSFSMSAKGSEGELLSESKEAAKKLINTYPTNQRYILSTNDLSAVQQRIIDAKSAQEEIDLIKYSPIQRNFGTIFNWQQETKDKIENRDQNSKRYELLFLSDFQSEFFKTKAIKPETVAEYKETRDFGQLKFVVGHRDREWEELDSVVKQFRDVGVDWPVWVMPVGAREEEQSMTAGEVAKKAFHRGYNVAARVHVYLFGNAIGT